MLRNTTLAGALALGLTLSFGTTAAAQTSKPQLDRLVRRLQSDPANQVLRERIIRLAKSMRPRPRVPEQVKALNIDAVVDMNYATKPSDYAAAVEAFKKASLLAPWDANVYYNLSVAQKKIGRDHEAAVSLMLCRLAAARPSECEASALVPTNRDTLQYYMSSLKTDPGSQYMRQRIIRLANAMNPKPTVPEKANELLGEAQAAIKAGKSQNDKGDFAEAVSALQKASLLVPWSGSVYFDLGVAQELSGQYGQAVSNFRLYLLAEPNARDAAQVEQRIGADEYAANHPAQPGRAGAEPRAGSEAQLPPRQQAAEMQEQANWALSNVSAKAGGCFIFVGCTNASLDVAISSGGGNATSVDYSVNDPAPMRMAREWRTGDTIRAGVPDVNHHCSSDVDDSILTDQTRDQWICAEYLEGGSGTISRIVSEDSGCSNGAGIYLTDMDPPNAGAQYCLSSEASRRVRESWQVGDRISVGDSSCGVLGQLLHNERTDQQICTQ